MATFVRVPPMSKKLADAEVDLIDAVRIFLSWQQEVDLLAGREDAVRGKAGAVPFRRRAHAERGIGLETHDAAEKHVDPRNDVGGEAANLRLPGLDLVHESICWKTLVVNGDGLVRAGLNTSGTCAATSQLSVTARPVLDPIWSVSPFRRRAFTVASRPCQ